MPFSVVILECFLNVAILFSFLLGDDINVWIDLF